MSGRKRSYEIYNEHFEHYINSLVNDMTDAQRASLPYELTKRGFDKSGFKANRLSFSELSYMAVTCFNKRMVIMFDDDTEDSGVTINSLNDALLVGKRKIPLEKIAENMQVNGIFVLGGRDLIEATLSMRLVAQSQLWRYLMSKSKGLAKGKSNGYRERRAVLRAMVGLLCKYDSLKGVINGEFGLSIAEWYCLMFYFDGEKKPGEFRKMFKGSPGGQRLSLKKANSRLTKMGYLLPRGQKSTQVYSLTAKGDELVNKIMQRVFIQPAKSIKEI